MAMEAVDGEAQLRGRRARAPFPTRLQRMMQLIGFTEDDALRVRATAPVLAPRATAISQRVYQRLLAQPETAGYFTGADGAPDAEQVAMRVESFVGYMAMALEAVIDDDLATVLARVGLAHTRRGGTTTVRIKGRYLAAAVSLLQDEIVAELSASDMPAGDVIEAIGAWRRLLAVHLDLLLAVYGSAEGTPHWY